MARANQVKSIHRNLQDSLAIIREYKWLIDAYVLDFYTDHHWARLPRSWRTAFEGLEDVHLLADLLLLESSGAVGTQFSRVLPLSLLALRESVRRLSASRVSLLPVKNGEEQKHFLYKQVKEKKRHEINGMASLSADSARRCGTDYVVDFGAGLGHLARIMAFQHGLSVCCLEQQEQLSSEARLLDERARRIHQRKQGTDEMIRTPEHLNFKLTSDTDHQELLQKIKEAFGIPPQDQSFSFGIVGLHPCGDLAIILTRFFLHCSNVRFLNIVGCCYMKLSTGTCHPVSHPVSRYLKQVCPTGLSYEAREIACHAIEVYADRLRTNNYDYLKIHCYRSLVERILCRHDKELRHCGLKSVRTRDGLAFQDYARLVTEPFVNLKIQDDEFSGPQITRDLAEWKKVVVFYTLRLFLAPLLETVILYDRLLLILETDEQCQCILIPTFDPLKSPRNHVLIAERTEPRLNKTGDHLGVNK